jgi:hypothetical protein
MREVGDAVPIVFRREPCACKRAEERECVWSTGEVSIARGRLVLYVEPTCIPLSPSELLAASKVSQIFLSPTSSTLPG